MDLQNPFSMEEFQFKIDLKNIKLISSVSEFPDHKRLLYIFHANKIPPHIGWSENNTFYSLKATGLDIGLDTNKINHIVLKKKIPTLIVEIVDFVQNEHNTKNIFRSYGEGLDKGKTCLNPIDEVLFNQVKHDKIGDLLETLLDMRMNLVFYGVNLPQSFQGILEYSKDDIEKRIFELQ